MNLARTVDSHRAETCLFGILPLDADGLMKSFGVVFSVKICATFEAINLSSGYMFSVYTTPPELVAFENAHKLHQVHVVRAPDNRCWYVETSCVQIFRRSFALRHHKRVAPDANTFASAVWIRSIGQPTPVGRSREEGELRGLHRRGALYLVSPTRTISW